MQLYRSLPEPDMWLHRFIVHNPNGLMLWVEESMLPFCTQVNPVFFWAVSFLTHRQARTRACSGTATARLHLLPPLSSGGRLESVLQLLQRGRRFRVRNGFNPERS